jgi:hypothetical protein
MRNELVEIERIEKYLSKELNPSELIAFEEELKNNISLQEKVNQQKILLKGIRKKAFKELAKSTFKKYKLIKKLRLGGLIGGGVIVVTILILISQQEVKQIPESAPIKTPNIDTIKVTPTIIELKDSAPQYLQLPKTQIENIFAEPPKEDITSEKSDNISSTSESKLELPIEEIKEVKVEENNKKKDILSGWKGSYIMSEKISTLAVNGAVSENGEIYLLNSSKIKSDAESLDGQSWKFTNDNTKIIIAQNTYPISWIEKDKSFTVKIKDKTMLYECTFKFNQSVNQE